MECRVKKAKPQADFMFCPLILVRSPKKYLKVERQSSSKFQKTQKSHRVQHGISVVKVLTLPSHSIFIPEYSSWNIQIWNFSLTFWAIAQSWFRFLKRCASGFQGSSLRHQVFMLDLQKKVMPWISWSPYVSGYINAQSQNIFSWNYCSRGLILGFKPICLKLGRSLSEMLSVRVIGSTY